MIGYLTQNHPLVRAFGPVASSRPRRAGSAAPRAIRHAPRLGEQLMEAECLQVRGPLERPISGLAIDSRRVLPGAVYFCLPGRRVDGRSHVAEAVSRGAVAIVASSLPVAVPGSVTAVQVADVRVALARAAQRFYRFPDRSMEVVGVAGAQGKTSVAHVLKHLLNGDQRVGLVGSIHYELGLRTVPSFGSTPEALEVYGMMAQMRDAGCRHVVLEVSDTGFAEGRLQGMQWSVAVLARVTPAEVTPEKFLVSGTGSRPAAAVINVAEAAGRALVARLAVEAPEMRVVTCGRDAGAQVRAEDVRLQAGGTRLRLVWPGGALAVESPLVGLDHVDNLLAAVAAAWALGRDPRVILARLRAFPGVPGRLERLDEGQPFSVWVDAANTPAALRRALRSVRVLAPGRLFVVFGGGAGRGQRSALAQAAQEGAERAIATAENPRGETQESIFAEMRAGLPTPERVAWVADRREAIAAALGQAQPGDGVLIAGRGHEAFQELAGTVIPFDDRRVARELLRGRKA